MHLQAPETCLGWDNRHLEGPATSGSKRMFMTAANTNICLSVSLNFNILLEKGLPTPHFVGYLIHWGKKTHDIFQTPHLQEIQSYKNNDTKAKQIQGTILPRIITNLLRGSHIMQ